MTIVLKVVINCESLDLEENFQGTCFRHVFSKPCQYGTAEERCKDLKYVSIKFVQGNLQKYITWPKNFGKGRQEWKKACVDIGIHPKKLNKYSSLFHYYFNSLQFLKLYKRTNLFYYWLCCKFASKVIMFQEALQFCSNIAFYYSKQIVVRVIGRIPPPLSWHISQIMVDCLSPIVSACVLNQSCGHWLLNDALHFDFS
jgi:hypothetical protein